MSECYLVIMGTGEYEDYVKHVLKVFVSKSAAENYADTMRSELNNIGRNIDGNNSQSEDRQTMFNQVSLNGCPIDYNGAFIQIDGPFELDVKDS